MWYVAPLSRIEGLKEERILLLVCCHVGRNNKNLIRNITIKFGLL